MKIISEIPAIIKKVSNKVVAESKPNNVSAVSSEINLNNQPSALVNKVFLRCKKPEIIDLKPKSFCTATTKNYESSVPFDSKTKFLYIMDGVGFDTQKFHPKYGAKVLPIETGLKKTVDICNFAHPCGSIAIRSSLDEPLSTSGLMQCCAVSFVDKKNNSQVLLHLCPTIHKKDNEDLIKYILNGFDSKNLEISIAPGCDSVTDKTIEFVMNIIKENDEKAKVNFFEFPKDIGRVILENGKLKCIDERNFMVTECNPSNRLIYASLNNV
ncbi:MAG: hypothetical protein E7Z91_04130 [Cyanobacteria bacterium SIG30]|nr:hypothetical protein [Cyanobacteria bacterium SIG30]